MVKEKRSILLMHPIRREIYRIVSETPGSYFFEIASALELPHGTVAWHLKKLESSGLVGTMRFAGRRVFFSEALRSEDVEKAFVVLKSEATQQVFLYVLNNDGCYQAQISDALNQHHDTIRHHIHRLKKAELINSLRQGRTVRYTLGRVGESILNSNTEVISKAYVEHLFAKLKEECLTPEIIELGGGRLTIRVSCPGKDDAYLSIDLKGWEFTSTDYDELEFSSKPPDSNETDSVDVNEIKNEQIEVVTKRERPKIVKL